MSTKLKGLSKILTPQKRKDLSVPDHCLDFTFHSPSVDGSFLLNPFELENEFGNMSEIAICDEEPSNNNTQFPLDIDINISSGSNYSPDNSFKLEFAEKQREIEQSKPRNSSPMKLDFDKEIYLVSAIN